MPGATALSDIRQGCASSIYEADNQISEPDIALA
jgi:hypothetical protein